MLTKNNDNNNSNEEHTKKDRLKEVDILRAVAIILIICGHLVSYTTVQSLGSLHGLVLVTGLGFFTFLSGFSLHYGNGDIHTKKETFQFFKKRVIRIYPLYLVTLFLFGLCFQYLALYHRLNLDIVYYLIHGMGTQILLSPGIGRPIFTLWYIGFILLCYSLYPLLTSTKNNKMLLLATFFTLLIFLILRVLFNIIDITVFWFYCTFVMGIMFSRTNFYISNRYNSKTIVILTIIMLVFASIYVLFYIGYIWSAFLETTPGIIVYIIVTNVYIISAILVLFWVFRQLAISLSERTYKILLSISISSYAAYLFHRLLFAALMEIMIKVNMNSTYQSVIVVFVGLPLLFIISYYVQLKEDRMFKTMRSKLLDRRSRNY